MGRTDSDNYSNEPLNSPKSYVKWLEVPIHKFNSVVPHFVELLKRHDTNISKLKKLNQWEELRRENTSASITVNQLTSLLTDMDNLRNQVVDSELSKFDKLIHNSRLSALNAIKSHQDIPVWFHPPHYIEDETSIPELKSQNLQVVADLNEKIKRQEQCASEIEELQNDIQDIQDLFQDFSQLVHHQGEHVDKIEEHVETAHHNVLEGESMLCQAVKYKKGMYPLMGAVLGSVLGGPVGMVAGFKLGGLTAVGFGVLGFTGGKLLKNQNEVSIQEAELHRQALTN